MLAYVITTDVLKVVKELLGSPGGRDDSDAILRWKAAQEDVYARMKQLQEDDVARSRGLSPARRQE